MKAETLTLPGAVDLHVHLREPGDSNAETISSGTRAAMLGGFVLVCDMPNNPGRPTWSLEAIKEKHSIIEKTAHIPVATYAGSQPDSDNIAELAKMAPYSMGLKSYATKTTGNQREYEADDFAEIFKEWHRVAPDKPIMLHGGEGNLHDFVSLIAHDLKHHLHVCHINNLNDVEVVREAKDSALPVTCGVCPHHLLKTAHSVFSEGAFAQMKPPLVEQADAEELFHHLINGDIDVVESDHAPHSYGAKEKAQDNQTECYGVPGVEFVMPLFFYQMSLGRISLKRIIEVTSINPARVIGVRLSRKTKVSWRMDRYRIENEITQVKSAAGWTPYLGMQAVGMVKGMTIGGKDVIKDGFLKNKVPKIITRGATL